MSPFFASLAPIIMFALPTFLLLLVVGHGTLTLSRFVRELRTTDRSIEMDVKP